MMTSAGGWEEGLGGRNMLDGVWVVSTVFIRYSGEGLARRMDGDARRMGSVATYIASQIALQGVLQHVLQVG